MKHLQALYQLQMLEASLDKSKLRIDEITAQIEDDEAVRAAKDTYDAREKDYHQAEAALTDLELEIESLKKKIADNNQLLYSGKITNPKELQDRENELESLDRRQTRLESDRMEAIEKRQVTEQAYDDADQALKATQANAQSQNADLEKEKDKLQRQIRKWLKERKQLLPSIPDDMLKTYRQLKPKKRGVAVARLDGDACSVCRVAQNHMIVQQVKQNSGIVLCNNCSRILVEI